MAKQVVIMIGMPGAGKDTQALLLTEKFGIAQVPSSQIIRKKFADNPDDPVIQREKELFDSGKLNTPELVAKWIMEFVEPIAHEGKGISFSGSPRTLYEARAEFPELIKLYGPANVRVIHFVLDENDARRRILSRWFCQKNRHPFMGTPEQPPFPTCPTDGSPLERRALDNADKLDERFKEYYTRTEPSLDVAREFDIPIFDVDASQSPEKIHHDIVSIIRNAK